MTKTNNDAGMLQAKINLRIESMHKLKEIKVLELFGGEDILWDAVRKQTSQEIEILSIDINKYNRLQLQGDNAKFIDSLDLNAFTIIDIDAWGSPYKQLDIVFKRKYTGIVHCTFIQTMMGKLSTDLLISLGYSKKMISKVPSIFNRNGIGKFKQYLANKGVKEINIISKGRKNYLWFSLKS